MSAGGVVSLDSRRPSGVQTQLQVEEAEAAARRRHPAGSMVMPDPRRPGRGMLSVWCWCGRFYTITTEEAHRRMLAREPLCPDPDCERGQE